MREYEFVATNEQRLLENPRIIELLYMNKNTRMSTADRIVELAARNGLAVDDGLQMPLLQVVDGHVGLQRLRDGVALLALVHIGDFLAPPRQLDARHRFVGAFVDGVVDLAAKGIQGGDGSATLRRQGVAADPVVDAELEEPIEGNILPPRFLLDVPRMADVAPVNRMVPDSRVTMRFAASRTAASSSRMAIRNCPAQVSRGVTPSAAARAAR